MLLSLKDTADIVQSFAIAAAALIGGGWALFRFRALNEAARASAELDRARLDLERRASIETTVSAVPLRVSNSFSLLASVRVKNSGNRIDLMDWALSTLSSASVVGFSSTGPEFGPVRENRLSYLHEYSTTTVYPGEMIEFQFLIPIDGPGLYFIEFNGRCSADYHEFDAIEHDRVGKPAFDLGVGTSAFCLVQ
jgi:hypothetical protein